MDKSVFLKDELSLREIQLESLRILKDIDTVCRREGIRYWIMFGSLIGAVRHNGFIPWDDDLDIAMPRKDYERFLSIFDNKPSELCSYKAVRPDAKLNRPFLITRITNPEFKMIGEYGDEVDELGTFVDVYPLDGVANEMEIALKREEEAYKLVFKYIHASNFACNNRNNGAFKNTLKRIRSKLMKKPETYQEHLSMLCREYDFDASMYVSNLSWTMTPQQSIYKRGWFNETCYMEFEDMTVPVPAGYDALLRCDYGDYLKLPPENERVGHHFYSIIRRTNLNECMTMNGFEECRS